MGKKENHHFVSQCLLKKFLNEKKQIFIYDKVKNNYFPSNGTRNIFSKNNLNTIKDSEGKFDTESIEDELNKKFESKFHEHYQKIFDWVEYGAVEDAVNILDSVKYIARLGLIGEMRNPVYKKESESQIIGILDSIMNYAVPDLKKDYELDKEFLADLEFKIPGNFGFFADKVFERLGKWTFRILVSEGEDKFIISDCTAFLRHHRLNDYPNDNVKDIAQIGIPLNSNYFLSVTSNRLIENGGLFALNSMRVSAINKATFDSAKEWIACTDENYLKSFVEGITGN